jgi:hypothetical protein
MIELFRKEHDPEADWVEASLRELVLDYHRVVVPPGEAGDMALPALRHDDRLISGKQALLDLLGELEELAESWRRFQSDSCYIDNDGDSC